MSYENVKLWFAKDGSGNFVTIDEISDGKENTYSCPMCGSNLIPKAVKSKQVSSHFAHVDASKCNAETMIHWWFKNKFLEQGDSFEVVSDKERQYICKEVLVEQSYGAADQIYRPDVTVITECGNTIFFEMDYSNKKKVQDYIDIWLELRNVVVEVDVKKLMMKDKVSSFKALYYNGKCFNTKKNDLYYNTIGKYKEGKLVDNVDQETKQRIRQLDWFWSDVFRFKTGEIEIECISEIIDAIDGEEEIIVKQILKKSMCSDLYKKYKKFKALDDLVKFEHIPDENQLASNLTQNANNIIKRCNAVITLELNPKKCVKYVSYYHGSRKYPYKSRPEFSHYEYFLQITYEGKLIKNIGITNRIMQFSDTQLQNYVSDLLKELAERKIKEHV